MGENTLQFLWIQIIVGNLEWWARDRDDVFVGGHLFWYPVEGQNQNRSAPDAMVVIGRPKGHRASYLQWEEENTPPQVVFQVLSRSNSRPEMADKLAWYGQYGVQEYYEIDPEGREMSGWVAFNGVLVEVDEMDGHASPLVGTRFGFGGDGEIELRKPTGQTYQRMFDWIAEAEAQRERADEAQRQLDLLRDRVRQAGLDPDAIPGA